MSAHVPGEGGKNLAALTARASILLNADKAADCIQMCVRALFQDRDYLPALELKARAHWRLGQYRRAIETLESALLLNPYDPGYRYMKGDCLQMLGLYGEAMTEFQMCAKDGTSDLANEASRRVQVLDELQRELLQWRINTDPEFRRTVSAEGAKCVRKQGFQLADVRLKVQSARTWDQSS